MSGEATRALPGNKQASVALVGNPNTGKTTLFNALTGLNHRVGNYPGVTVEWKAGSWKAGGRDLELVDLPGTYSLIPRSADEAVVRDTLRGLVPERPRPDLVVVILDASNLERNLYLLTQVSELDLPMVAALNMGDIAESKGISVDAQALSGGLGVPVVPIRANRREGLADLQRAVLEVLAAPGSALAPHPHAQDHRPGSAEDVRAHYLWIRQVLKGALKRPDRPVRTVSDRVDQVLTHKAWGSLAFLAVMALMFQFLFNWAQPVMNGMTGVVGWLGSLLAGLLPAGVLRSLLLDGVVAGVGAVVTFLPQIAILFLFIAVLEDCGYMARTAFLMDKLLAKAGLSGKSFIPMLSSYACAVPGIMATRTIESRKDRMVTILVLPLMSCSARLPVYTIFIAAFVPNLKVLGLFRLQGLTLLGLYLVGLAVAVPVAWLLRRTYFKGEVSHFIMELPSYKWPDGRTVFLRVWKQCLAFLRRAGTVTFSVTVLVWALSYFPRPASVVEHFRGLKAAASAAPAPGLSAAALDRQEAGQLLRDSYLGRLGRATEPAFRPLGWDWRIAMAAIASFPAREVVVATLSTIFNLGRGGDDGEALSQVLKKARWPDGRPLFTLATALSIMVFFALCMQCVSTLAVMRSETGTWVWPAFAFVYMTALAYVAAMAAFQFGTWMGW